MHDHITITGTVGSDPEAKVSSSTQVSWTTFRFVTNQRRRTADGGWEDASSNWYTVTCFRSLGRNVASCVKKGERLIVSGRLELAESGKDEARRVWPQIVASSIGHDLNFGIATAERRQKPAEAAEAQAQFGADPRTGEVLGAAGEYGFDAGPIQDAPAGELVGASVGGDPDADAPF